MNIRSGDRPTQRARPLPPRERASGVMARRGRSSDVSSSVSGITVARRSLQRLAGDQRIDTPASSSSWRVGRKPASGDQRRRLAVVGIRRSVRGRGYAVSVSVKVYPDSRITLEPRDLRRAASDARGRRGWSSGGTSPTRVARPRESSLSPGSSRRRPRLRPLPEATPGTRTSKRSTARACGGSGADDRRVARTLVRLAEHSGTRQVEGGDHAPRRRLGAVAGMVDMARPCWKHRLPGDG